MVYIGTAPYPVTITTRIVPFLVENPYQPSFVTVAERQVDRRSKMGCLPCSIFSALPGGFFFGTSPERKGHTSRHRRPRRHVDHYQWPTPESGKWWDRCSSGDASNLLQQTRLSAFVDSFCRPWLVMKRFFQFWSSCVIHIWEYLFLMTSGQTTRLMVFGFSWSQNCLPISVILRLTRLIYKSPLDTEFEKPQSISKISKLYNCCTILL